MTDKMIRAIRPYCNEYGDKFLMLMEQCNVTNLPDVPEDKAQAYLSDLQMERFREVLEDDV